MKFPAKSDTLAALAACLLTLPLLAQAAAPGCAAVEVQNVRPQQGRLMIAAYPSAEAFGKTASTSMALPAGETPMRFELCGLSGERVALMLYQDLNSDGQLGKNLLGMPTEPWGASGHPGMTGPSWDTTSVPLDGQPIVVQMSK